MPCGERSDSFCCSSSDLLLSLAGNDWFSFDEWLCNLHGSGEFRLEYLAFRRQSVPAIQPSGQRDWKDDMKEPKIRLATCLIILVFNFAGCGQKGPLYLDDAQDETAERVKSEDEKRQKELKDLERRNESQPGITY
jgi:predicted small lipoprotein YifL